MRALTNTGSSPTGRCSGLDKVPWRDLTLLDKLRILAWGFHHSSFIIHRVAVSYLLLSSMPRLIKTFLLFIALMRILRGAWGHESVVMDGARL